MSASAKLSRQLSQALAADAQAHFVSGDPVAAIQCQMHAYSLCPNDTRILHAAAEYYLAVNDSESATLCRRGVIPHSAEIQYFNAQSHEHRVVKARRAHQGRFLKAQPAEQLALSPPVSNAVSVNRPEFRRTHSDSRGCFVSELSDGSVWFDGFNTLIQDSKGQLINEHVKGSPWVSLEARRWRRQTRLEGTVCFLDARSSSIYYHWMLDVLPKLGVLQKAGIELSGIDYFLVKCDKPFKRDSLLQFGIHQDRIVTTDSATSVSATKLLVPYLKNDLGDRIYSGLGLGLGSWAPHWLKDQFVRSTQRSDRKLYLGRSSKDTRPTRNEPALIAALQERGFECLNLEQYSVGEQANLLAECAVVIAPHGAALTNIAYCQPGTLIIELFGDYVVPCYWALANLCQLDYRQYLSHEANCAKMNNAALQAAANQQTNNAERRAIGIDLDVDDVMHNIDKWLEDKRCSSKPTANRQYSLAI